MNKILRYSYFIFIFSLLISFFAIYKNTENLFAREISYLNSQASALLGVVKEYKEAGRNDKACELLDRIIKIISNLKERVDERIDLLISVAHEYNEVGRKDKAFLVIEQAIIANRVEYQGASNIDNLIKIAEGYIVINRNKTAEILEQILNPKDIYLSNAGIVEVANIYVKIDQNNKAGELLANVLKTSEPGKYPSSYINLLSDVAFTYIKMQDYEKVQYVADMINGSSAYNRCNVLAYIAIELNKKGQTKQALEILSQACEIVKTTKDQSDLTCIIGAYIKIQQPEKASQMVDMVENVLEKSDLLRNIAISYAKSKEYEKAIQVANTIGYTKRKCETLIEIATQIINSGQKDKATEIITQVMSVDRIDLDIKDWNTILCDITGYYVQSKNIQKAIETANAIEEYSSRVICLTNISVELAKNGQRNDSLKILSQACEVANKSQEDHDRLLAILSSDYLQIQEYEKAIQLANEIKDTLKKADMLIEIAIQYNKINEDNKASEVFYQAVQIANTIENVESKRWRLDYIKSLDPQAFSIKSQIKK